MTASTAESEHGEADDAHQQATRIAVRGGEMKQMVKHFTLACENTTALSVVNEAAHMSWTHAPHPNHVDILHRVVSGATSHEFRRRRCRAAS